ncbi:MAG: acyl-CoA dehydrogenase family protein [Acidimicrobiales bacterium]
MRLDLTEDQSFFQETARRFLEAEAPVSYARRLIDDPAGFDPAVYARAAELGWLAPLAPEDFGGGSVSSRAVADLAIVAEETGRTLFPGPLLESNLAAAAIARLGSDDQKARYLSDLVSGRITAALAWSSGEDGWPGAGAGAGADAGVWAEPTTDAGWRLSGVRHLVPYGSAVDLLVVAAILRSGVAGLFLVPADSTGVTSQKMETFDLSRRLSSIELAGADLPGSTLLGAGAADGSELDRLLILASVLQCAETVGAMERCFEMTLDYAKARRAFGRPIGSFQAIKHRLADMVLWLEWSKAAVEAAVDALDAGTGEAEAASVAKSVIGEHGPLLVRSAVQVHGGIGYTWEHDVHLFLRRVEANAFLYGSTDFHRSRLAGMVRFPVPS